MAKINREKVIILLQEKRKESREYYSTICDILERNSIIGRKNKEKMIIQTNFDQLVSCLVVLLSAVATWASIYLST